MSNPVTNPKSSTATQVPVSKVETQTTEKPSNGEVQEQKGIEVSPQVLHPQIIESKSANTVFERLDEGLKRNAARMRNSSTNRKKEWANLRTFLKIMKMKAWL